jgi:hypothetical protein
MVSTASAGVGLSDVTGELRVTTISGGITGTGTTPLADGRSTNERINLRDHLTSSSQISGGVSLRLMPTSSVHIDAASTSGSVDADGLPPGARQSERHSLAGNLSAGSMAPDTLMMTTVPTMRR